MNLTSGRQMKARRQRLNAYERQRLAFPLFCACVLTFSIVALSFVAPHKSETMTKKMNDHPTPPQYISNATCVGSCSQQVEVLLQKITCF